MPLKTLTTVPPGGYAYEQRDSGGTLLKKFHTTTMPFGHFVRTIQQFREANKLARVTIQETWADVDEEQCRRLGYDPEWCQKKTASPTSRNPLRKASEVVRRVASQFTSVKRGLNTFKEWADDGFALVDVATAQARAEICTGGNLGSPCPKNQDLAFSLDDTAAAIVKSQIERKNNLKLEVEGESGLHVCTVCNCLLKIKVFTPMETILAHTPTELMEEFKKVPHCWMNSPQSQTPAP